MGVDAEQMARAGHFNVCGVDMHKNVREVEVV